MRLRGSPREQQRLNVLRRAWRRILRIVLMPDPVMGCDRLTHDAGPAAPPKAEVSSERTP